MRLDFVFRKPKFPVICDFNNTVVSFKSAADMERKIMKCPLVPEETYDMIDSTAESRSIFYKDNIIVSPLSLERWTKRKLIDLYNNRDNKTSDDLYVLKNPDSKKLSVIIAELAGLLKDAINPGRTDTSNCVRTKKSNHARTIQEAEMKQITVKDITKVLEKLLRSKEDFFDDLLDQLSSEQPAIFDYLQSNDELNEKEQYYLLYITQMGWYIVKDILNRKAPVSEDFLYEQFDRNKVAWEDQVFESDGDDDEVRQVINYPNNQPHLMDYLTHLLTEFYDKSGKSVREKMFTSIVMDIKTVIDCLVLDEEKELAEICDREFSDKNFKSVKESVKGYIDEFRKSSSFMKLKHPEKDETEFIITAFSEIMYNYFLMLPLHWNARRAVKCVTEIIPAKVMADGDFFKSIEPVLVPFLKFCAEKEYVPDGKIIARRLRGITGQIMEESENEDNWGTGKALLKEAESKGVNLSDENELAAFIKKYNKEKAGSNMHGTGIKNVKPGRNDPCPCGSGKKYKKCCGEND